MESPSPDLLEGLPPLLKWAVTMGFISAGAVLYFIERRKKPATPLIAQDVALAIKTTEARAEAAEAEASRLRQEAALENIKQEIFAELGRNRQAFRELLGPIAADIAELRVEVGKLSPQRRR